MTLLFLTLLAATDSIRAPAPASQRGVTVEFRAGAAAGEVTAARSGPQWVPRAALHASVAYAPVSFGAVFLEYGQSGFGCRDGFCRDNRVAFGSRGAAAGVELRAGPLWVRGALTRSTLHSRWTTAEGAQSAVALASTGSQLGVGMLLPLDGIGIAGVTLAPGLRYTRHGSAMPGDADADGVAHITADIGFRLRLPFGR